MNTRDYSILHLDTNEDKATVPPLSSWFYDFKLTE
jgi:hypothetical protein